MMARTFERVLVEMVRAVDVVPEPRAATIEGHFYRHHVAVAEDLRGRLGCGCDRRNRRDRASSPLLPPLSMGMTLGDLNQRNPPDQTIVG
jgi:hypothetical protein